MRALVVEALDKKDVSTPGVEESVVCGELKRVEIRLTVDEVRRTKILADNEGFSVARWLVAAVRARITGTHQIGQREFEVLVASNTQLRYIGRHLNQIAKQLAHSPSDQENLTKAFLEEIRSPILIHTEYISRLLAANLKRWKVK